MRTELGGRKRSGGERRSAKRRGCARRSGGKAKVGMSIIGNIEILRIIINHVHRLARGLHHRGARSIINGSGRTVIGDSNLMVTLHAVNLFVAYK